MFFLFFDDRRLHMADSHSDDPVTYPFDMEYIERSFSKPVIVDGYREDFDLYDKLTNICHAGFDKTLPTCMMIFEDEDAMMAKMAPENLIIDYEKVGLPYFGSLGPISLDEIIKIDDNDVVEYQDLHRDKLSLETAKFKIMSPTTSDFISYCPYADKSDNQKIEQFRNSALDVVSDYARMMHTIETNSRFILAKFDHAIAMADIALEDVKDSIRNKMNFDLSSS